MVRLDRNDLHVEVNHCGGDDERYTIYDHDQDDNEFWHYDEEESLPGLNREGTQHLGVDERGKAHRDFRQRFRVCRFILEEYDSRWFGPNIYSE